MNWRMCLGLIVAGLCLVSSPAEAKWHCASSDHFVIYADDSPSDLVKFGEILEKYHIAMSLKTGRRVPIPSPSNRVTIYVVGSEKEVQELYGGGSKFIQGYFVPRAGGSSAFVQNLRPNWRNPDLSVQTLLHEYAHYFLTSSSRFGMPRWLSEGAAEFYSSASFEKDGSVMIGRPAFHRAAELEYAADVPIRELFDPSLYAARQSNRYSEFYGRSWLLYHFLTFNQSRQGQLTDYWQRTIKGAGPIEAAEGAFGDLDQLEGELDKYLRSRSWTAFHIERELLPFANITVTALSEGMSAMMPVIIRSQNGVDAEAALLVLKEARGIAARFPNDPGVQAALAESEFDADNSREAVDAADRAIAINPAETNAYVQKIYALFDLAEDADDRDEAIKKALIPLKALNRLENDHPIPLIYLYRSFVLRGLTPSQNAKASLEYALELAPFDQGLAFNVGAMQAADGRIRAAIRTFAPLAANPHDRKFAESAQELIESMRQAVEGQPFYIRFRTAEEAEDKSAS